MSVLETYRLILRRFFRADLDAMTRVFGDAEVMRFGDGVRTAEWVREWLERCLENDRQDAKIGLWTVVEKSRAEVIGYCGLLHYPDVGVRSEIETGYRLVRAAWGDGYATEAVIAVRDHAFGTLGIKRLIAMIDPENVASIRVAEKAGMRYEKDVMLEGFTHPDRVYAIATPEFPV